MSPAERLKILGPACVAEIHRTVALAPPPDAELVQELRRMFSPAVSRLAPDAARESDHATAA